jgi:uncharacterized membrane protein YhhN
MTTPPSSNSATPVPNDGGTSYNEQLYSIGKSVCVGASGGLLLSLPVSRLFFPMPPLAGFISGFVAGALFSQCYYSTFRELSHSEQVGALIAVYAIQTFATYFICLVSQVPIEFSASLLFPPAAICIAGIISLFSLSWEKGGETFYELWTHDPFKESDKVAK